MNKKKLYNINLFLVLFPIMIFAGKLIRWTILKSVLVDMSIGNGMISQIISGTTQFVFLSEVGMADAAGSGAHQKAASASSGRGIRGFFTKS